MMKKTKTKARKPAKKKGEPPKPKLIDGKYSHKFLLRLEPDEGKELEAVLSLTGNKTWAGAIKYALSRYKHNTEEISTLQSDLSRHRQVVRTLESAIAGFKQAFTTLMEVSSTEVTGTCPECERELDEDGTCENFRCGRYGQEP